MTDREKLIELLTDDYCPLLYMQGDVGGLADYLLSHGVTFQRWIPVTERLPEQRQEQTNADRIRTMSDEELAAFLSDDDRACPAVHSRCGKHVTFCVG